MRLQRKNGGRDWSADAQAEIIDFIPLSKPPLVAAAPEMADLYASGYSLEQIAKKQGKAKSTVKSTLETHGVVLRSAHPPFGFVVLRNQFKRLKANQYPYNEVKL